MQNKPPRRPGIAGKKIITKTLTNFTFPKLSFSFIPEAQIKLLFSQVAPGQPGTAAAPAGAASTPPTAGQQ